MSISSSWSCKDLHLLLHRKHFFAMNTNCTTKHQEQQQHTHSGEHANVWYKPPCNYFSNIWAFWILIQFYELNPCGKNCSWNFSENFRQCYYSLRFLFKSKLSFFYGKTSLTRCNCKLFWIISWVLCIWILI